MEVVTTSAVVDKVAEKKDDPYSSELDSDEEEQMKNGCEFCGSKENLKYQHWRNSYTCGDVYCDNDKCKYYHEWYVHSNDLTHGLPFIVKKEYQLDQADLSTVKNIHCHYCGSTDKENLEYVPTKLFIRQARKNGMNKLNSTLKKQWFCRNHRCLRRYIRFIGCKQTGVPYCISQTYGCVCRPATSGCICEPEQLRRSNGCNC